MAESPEGTLLPGQFMIHKFGHFIGKSTNAVSYHHYLKKKPLASTYSYPGGGCSGGFTSSS